MELSKAYLNEGMTRAIPVAKGATRSEQVSLQMEYLAKIRECFGQRLDTAKQIEKGYALLKGFVQATTATSGLTQYDLEQGARLLYPITTLFRNIIPRKTGGLGIQANWRSVTAVNPSRISIGLSEGHRGANMNQTVTDNQASFKTEGMDDAVTEQAYLAGLTFEDLYALAATTLLQGVMEGEELCDIGANNSLLLGTAATPAGTPHTTGGTLADASTYSLIVVALTFDGMTRSTVAAGVQLPYTRSNMDGSTDLINGFSGIQSAASSSINVSGGSGAGSITGTVAATRGAFGYAWYLGLTAGTEKLVAITGYPAVTIAALNASGQVATALPSTDTSISTLNYNGMLTQFVTSGSGAYYVDLAAAPLTTAGSGSGGITEINTAINSFYTNYRLIPTDIFMSGTDQRAMGTLILNGNTNAAPFFMSTDVDGAIMGGTTLKRYVNPIGFGTQTLDVHAHPFIPAGTIIIYSRTNPYPLSNVPNLMQKLLRRDYWSVEWPVVTLQKTMGVYFDGVLQCYFPPAFGVITGVRSAGT